MTSRYLMRTLVFFAFCSFFAFSFTPIVDAGGTFHVSRWNERIVINSDASLTISENVTFCFVTGYFSYAYRTIPHLGFDDMISISVTDDEGKSLGYSLNKGNKYEVRWEWDRIDVGSEPIEKSFILNYTLTNAMNYNNTDPDRDRLYWNIVTDYDVDIYNVNIAVVLPGKYDPNSISATSYYSISSTNPPEISTSATATIVSYHQPIIKAEEDYTLDIYFPATVERPPPTLTAIIKGYLDVLAPAYSAGMIVLGIIGIVKVRSFKRRSRDPEISTVGVSGDQPPTDVRPPEAGVLSDMEVWRKHFDSALLDLAQRGYLNIEVRSRERGFFRKTVEVESFEVTLSEKGKNALQSKDPDLKRYEANLLRKIGAMPLNKEELSKITYKNVRREFGLEVIKDELIERGMADSGGFEKKGTNLRILGGVILVLWLAFSGFYLFAGASEGGSIQLIDARSLILFFTTPVLPTFVFLIARTTGPRTVQGAKLRKQTSDFLEKKMRELKEKAKSSPLSTIQRINELAPWLVLHASFYRLLSAADKAMKNLDATGKQHIGILPSYIKVISSQRETMPFYYYNYWMWRSFYATASPSTGAPPSGGGGGGGGAGGGGGGGGGGAG